MATLNQLNAAGPVSIGQRTLQTAGRLQGLRQNEQVMQRQLQQDQAEQQAQQQDQINRQEGARLLSEGTPDEISAFGIKNPSVMKDFIEAANFKDQTAIGTRVKYAQNILSGNVSPREGLEARIAEVNASGGDSSGLQKTLDIGTDEAIMAAAEKDMAVIAPKMYESWRKASGIDAGLSDKPSAVQETEWYNKQSPEVQATHLLVKRGEKPTLDQKLEYEKAKSDIKEDSSISTARKKTSEQRRQGYIDSGVSSADNLVTVNRSIELMDAIKTGGIDNAIIRAKQMFGIESADEAELSYELGKSVLKQLKPTFGAAFTVNEMLELKRMEAGLGKSVAGNKRILANLSKMIKRSAERGLRAADSLGEKFAANEIRLALSGDQSTTTSANNPDVPELSNEEMLKMYGGQ